MSITHHKSPETSAGKSGTVDVGFVACFSSASSSKGVGHIELPVVTLLLFTEPRELCESRGGRPGFPVPSSPYGLWGRKATS